MTSGVWGADAGELRALAKDMSATAAQLANVLSTLTVQINTTEAWKGPDAEGFRQRWNTTHRSSLLGANSILSAAATALVQNAAQQENASAADGASGLPGGSNGGAGGWPGSDSGAGGAGGGTAPVPGLSPTQNSLLKDLLTNPGLLATGGVFNDLAVVDLFNSLTQLRLGGEFSSLQGALNFNKFASGFNSLNDFLSGENWGELTQGLSNVLGDSALAGKVGSAAEFLGSAGKVLGPVGAVLGVVSVGTDIAKKDYGRAGYDGVAAGLGIAALVTPPPADLALGLASGGMALGAALYDNVPVFHDAADATGEAIGTAAHATGEAIGAGAEAVAHGAEDFADGVAETAKKFWPFG
ncbi:hypothetical protein [Subtercola sp. RTI3]|uniref:WXG100 family type VII secretion target n=1 Tax=Subtercola sp. RTI3 TaxID=3048639 RepID=UPI002B22F940|nr:hypothetical protein [Subtercola sp. RTI3]MEA9986561.1 hypothetical protein [Subtercola sp. RTI3]